MRSRFQRHSITRPPPTFQRKPDHNQAISSPFHQKTLKQNIKTEKRGSENRVKKPSDKDYDDISRVYEKKRPS